MCHAKLQELTGRKLNYSVHEWDYLEERYVLVIWHRANRFLPLWSQCEEKIELGAPLGKESEL